MKLTKTAIEAFTYEKADGQKDIRWDDALPGFGVRIFPTGKKSFVVFYRSKGRQHVMTLGQYGVLTLDEARKKAKSVLGRAVDGEDPLEARGRHSFNIEQLCTLYMETHARHKKSWKEDKRRIDRHIVPRWGSWSVNAVTHAEVVKMHRDISAPYEANRVLELLKVLFKLARRMGYHEGVNPAEGVKENREVKRDRWVTPDELPRLAKAINEESNVYARAALWIYLLTGMRRSEVLNAKWTDVDWKRRELRLGDTKAGRIHYVPLSEPAVTVLRNIPRIAGNPYVFPGAVEGKHLVEIKGAWGRVKKAAKIEDVRLHDLRRTVGSWMAQAGNSLHLIGRVLNHSSTATTAVYARFAQDHVRDAMEDHGRRIMAVVGEGASAEILEFKPRKRG